MHPRLPGHMLVALLTDENVAVRRAAVKNVNLTDNMLLIALHDKDLGIRAYARLLSEETNNA